ncbi:MAG: T9SS type A sorting domain-containing protein [Rhodothermales bacterium]
MSRLFRILNLSTTAIVVLVLSGVLQSAGAQNLGKRSGYGTADTSALKAKLELRSAMRLSKTSLIVPDSLANTGFEDDTLLLDPWAVIDSGSGSWFVQMDTLSPVNGNLVPEPTEGEQAAMTDQGDPGTHILFQDVALLSPPATIGLKYDMYVHSHADWVVPSTGTLSANDTVNQHVRVDIMDPNAEVDDVGAGVWMNLYRPVPMVDTTESGYTEMSADLSAFAGQTVRLRFAEVDNQDVLNFGVDNVRLMQTPILPATPTLLTPLNGATDIPLEGVELRWSAVTYANRYNVQVATDPEFSSIIWSTNVGAHQVDFVPPDPGVTYYWRAQSEGVHGKSKFSAPFHFTTVMPIPNTPTLLTPLNGATDVPNTVELRWTAEEWALRYNVQVATDAAFTALVMSTNVPADQVSFVAPAPGVTYYWRAQSVGQFGNSTFSAPFHFTTVNPRPDVVTLVAPAFGSMDLESPVTLEWNAAANADEYLVQVSQDSMFADTLSSLTTSNLTMDFVPPFAGATYYWRVNGMGPGGSSPGFSDVWKFSVAAEGSLVPMALYPEDGATGVPVEVSLKWEAPITAPGNDEAVSKTLEIAFYHVQVATDESFEDMVVDQDSVMADSLHVTGLMHETEYYWRVAGVDAQGNFTFNEPSSFTTVIAAPAAVTLVAPENGATEVSGAPEFSWQAIAGATAYQLQVSKEMAFASPVIDEDALTGTTLTPTTALDYSSGYFWRVRAMNEGGWGEWSEVRSFTTATGTAIEDDVIPASYALHDNYPNPFNPSTTIVVDLPEATTFKLTVYDVEGHEVMVVASGPAAAGRHSYTVDGSKLSSGMYLYRIESPKFKKTKQMMLLK